MDDSPSGIRIGLSLAVSVLSVSTAAILIRLTSTGPMSVAALRLTFATLVLVPFIAWRGLPGVSLISRKDALLLVLTGVCLALHFALWITSLYFTTVAASVFLVSMSPVFVALLGGVFLEEKTTTRAAIGIGVALIGVFLITGDRMGFGMGFRGEVLALGGAVAVSLYLVAGRRLRQKIPLLTYVFLVYGVAAVVLLGTCMVQGIDLLGLNSLDYAILLCLGVVPSHLGHTLYNYLLKFLDPKIIAVSTLGEPVLSSLLALMVLREVPSSWVVAASPLILLGIYLTATGSSRRVTVPMD